MGETVQHLPQITYGSVISISHIRDDDALIAGDGFIKRSVILKGMSPHVHTHIRNFSDQFNQFYMSNCLFLVCPKVSNTIKNQILDLKVIISQKTSKEESLIKDPLKPLIQKQEDPMNESEIRDFQIRLLNEYKYNIESYEKEKTVQVTHDQPIQLLHIASSKFLACHDKEAKFENQNYKLCLDSYSSEATLFKIVPAFKYQKDGDQMIYASEVVRLIRANPLLSKTTFVHCSGEIIDVKKNKINMDQNNQTNVGVLKIQKREVNASIEDATSWKLNLFSQYVPEQTKLLKIGDILWLHHSERNATLAATRKKKVFDKAKFHSQDLKDFLAHENLVVNVQSSCSDSTFEQYQGNTYSMWILESINYREGGLIQYEKHYRLKHFSSGLYLAVARPPLVNAAIPKVKKDPYSVTKQLQIQIKTDSVSFKEPPAKFVLQNNPDKNTLFEFVGINLADIQQKFIKSGSFIYLKNVENKKYIDIISKLDEIGTQQNQDSQKSNLLTSYLKPVLKNEKEKSESAIFKLYKANDSETWEVMFLDSCNKILLKFLYNLSGFQWKKDPSDADYLKMMQKKLKNSLKTINELDDFVNNKVNNSTPDQKYGSLSKFRQTLLRQQYFIDILIKIIHESLNKNELEMWQQRESTFQEIKQLDLIDENKMKNSINKKRQPKGVTKKEILEYIIQKADLCTSIFKLLGSVIKNNNENQLYIYDLLPYFQIHTKFLPSAISFIIELYQFNMALLLKLSQNLRIEFDYTTQQAVQVDMSQKIKVLINLYEKDPSGQQTIKAQDQTQASIQNQNKIAIKTHEKISQKPINLINFFFNVLWDKNSLIKEDYLRFLSSICRYHQSGVQINQENIYKLYKIFNAGKTMMGIFNDESPQIWDGNLRMIQDKLYIPEICEKDSKQMKFISEQLHFFAEVSYGRNYIWKHELISQFPQQFLFKNIWSQQQNPRLKELQHLWCKLSMSLYVNHQPLRKIILPNYCRLFRHCDLPKQFNNFEVFSAKNHQQKSNFASPLLRSNLSFNDDQVDMSSFKNIYRDFIQDLLAYFEGLKQTVTKQVDDRDKSGLQILNDQLVYNSSELLLLLLQLDIFELVDTSQKSQDTYYMKIVEPLIFLIQYDRKNLNYLNASMKSLQGVVKESKEKKAKPFNPMKLGELISFPNIELDTQPVEEDTDNFNEAQVIDDEQIFGNNIMRGFISLNNQLDALTYTQDNQMKIQIDFKLKICSILDHFLDKRQNFLISNIMVFFKKRVLKDGGFAKNSPRLDQVIGDELDGSPEIKQDPKLKENKLQQQVDEFLLGLIPNIARTGIKEIDEPEKEITDAFAFMNIKNLVFSETKPGSFTNYFNHFKIEGFTESYDLDQYLSLMQGDDSIAKKPIASILPYLLNTFFLVHDELLEERCLNIMMRVFNQREELRFNLNNLQMLFDNEKSQLFQYIDTKMVRLTELIERSEIWLSEFVRKTGTDFNELKECHDIIQNLSQGFHYNLVFEGGDITLMNLPGIIYRYIIVEGQNNGEVDPLKQSLMRFLEVHQPIIELIKNGFHNLVEIMLDPTFPSNKKQMICNLYTAVYQFLQNFVKGNKANQLILYEEISIFQQFIQYNVGQCALIQEIFRDNFKLLTTKVDQNLLKPIIEMILHEGRQENFIDLVSVLLKCKNKYLFDNQLLILNTFLPLGNMTDSQIKVLYADGMKGKHVKFNLDDTLYLKRDDLYNQLRDVEWKDTYRDEPFRYHCAILDMLIQTSLIQASRRVYDPFNNESLQRNNFNISAVKLKKLIPVDILLSLLLQADSMVEQSSTNKSHLPNIFNNTGTQQHQKPDQDDLIDKKKGFSLLKLQICEFIRLIHITSDKRQAQSTEVAHLQKEFMSLLEREGRRLEAIQNGSQFDSQYYLPYLIEGLIPLIISYHERILSNQTGYNYSDLVQTIDYFSLKLAECLKVKLYNSLNTRRQALIIKRFAVAYQNDIFKRIILIRSDDPTEAAVRLLSLYEDNLDEDLIINNKPVHDQYNSYMDSPAEGASLLKAKSQISPSPQKQKKGFKRGSLFGSSLFGSNKSVDVKMKNYAEQKDFDEEDLLVIEDQWNEFKSTLVDSKKFLKQIELEKQVLADAIINVESLLDDQHSKDVEIKPNIGMVIKKFINFLSYAVKQSKNKDTVVTLLKIMTKIIQKEEDIVKRVELQNHFDKLGATKMILLVISQHSNSLNSEILLSILQFANTMLIGGNQKVQKTIYQFFQSYQKSETIFSTFANIIQLQILNIEQRSKERSQITQSNLIKGNDEEGDEMNQEEDQEATSQQEVILNQILQFFQSCVKGHYLELQNYLRFQTNSRTSYDMINIIADLLKTYYFEERTVRMYDNMIKCLDTLNEMVQGPCYENQIAVSESKIFDIVQDLFTLKKDKIIPLISMKSSKNSSPKSANSLRSKTKITITEPIEPWMIARIQNKILILLLALLEMREIKGKNSMVKRVMRNLPIKVLERHMSKVYKNFYLIYEDHYQMDCLDHMVGDPRTLEQSSDRHKKYFQTITQNGFYMFQLVCYYFETDEIFDSTLVNMHKTYLKQIVRQDDGILSPHSTLGQLLALALDLLEQSLILAQAVSNATLKKLKGSIPDDVLQQRVIKQKNDERTRRLRKTFNFFMSNTGHIEIVRNDSLQIVFFPILPYCRCLPKDQKNFLQENVDRSSTKAKVQGLIKFSVEFIEIMIHEEQMKRFYIKNRIIGFFANYIQLWKDIAYYLTLVLNLFIVASFSVEDPDGSTDDPSINRMNQYIFFRKPDWNHDDTIQIFFILGIAMTLCSLIVVSFFMAKIAPLIIKRALTQEPLIIRTKPGIFTRLTNLIYRLFYIFFCCLADFEVLYYLAYGFMAIAGTVIHPFFYSFHLTVVLIRYPTLNNVVKSITEPRESLLLTLVLLIIMSYVYTLFVYLTLQVDYAGNCHQVLYCFLYIFEWNFKVPGGIGGKMTQSANSSLYNPARLIGDGLCNLIIVIIMTSIVLGIIIDTFGSLRKQENQKQSDIQDQCYICGLENVVFEKKSDGSTGGFQNHIKVNHYMWNYLYYIAYIRYKNVQDYSGNESYVSDKLKSNELSWIPFNRALELANFDDDLQAIEGKKLNGIKEEMLSMLENTKQILKAIKLKEKHV